MKNDLKRKAISTLLAGSLIFGSGALNAKVDAYKLKEPTTTLEDFNSYNGVKIFINGRLVEFNDSLGYPYISKEGRTMIPLRAVAETFTATVNYDSNNKMAIVSKHDTLAEVKIDYNKIRINEKDVITTDTKAIIKNGRTYIPLRALFENFGLNVRWDQNTKTAHIETLNNNFNNIDFKDKKIISIKELDLLKIDKVVYDGVEVDKNYVNILKNSDQYKVFINDNNANIYSYQYLTDLNYIFGKTSENYQKALSDKGAIRMKYITDDEFKLFVDMSSKIYLEYIFYSKGEDLRGKTYTSNYGTYLEMYNKCLPYAKEIAKEAKDYSSNKETQVKYVVDRINNYAEYSFNIVSSHAYDTFINKISSCRGYQAAFEMVMKELGIPCLNVSGIAAYAQLGHEWGHVYIDGNWIGIDCTNNVIFDNETKEETLGLTDNDEELTKLLEITYKFN